MGLALDLTTFGRCLAGADTSEYGGRVRDLDDLSDSALSLALRSIGAASLRSAG